jgi:hypothetical protein
MDAGRSKTRFYVASTIDERGEQKLMARTDAYRNVKRWCVMCQNEIPADRKWDAITCSPECTKARKDYGRSRKDQTECRYCLRPSTPEERARYSAWRRWEKAGIKEEQSAATLLREVERLKRKLNEYEGFGDGSHAKER